MRTKRTLAAMLALSVGMSMTACGENRQRQQKQPKRNSWQEI